MSDVVRDLMNTIHEMDIKNNDLEKENAELKLQLEIAQKFHGELLNELPEGLAEFKGLSLKDMADYYIKKLEQLKEQGDE